MKIGKPRKDDGGYALRGLAQRIEVLSLFEQSVRLFNISSLSLA